MSAHVGVLVVVEAARCVSYWADAAVVLGGSMFSCKKQGTSIYDTIDTVVL